MNDHQVFRIDNHATVLAETVKRYPFAEMEVGDAFRLNDGDNVKSIRISAIRYGARHGRKFSVRAIDGHTTCVRIA